MIREFIERNDQKVQRAIETLFGLTIWSIIIFPLWGSFVIPRVVAYFVIAFDVYWLYKSFEIAFLGLRGYMKIKKAEKTNWQKKCQEEENKGFLDWEEIRHVVIIPNAGETAEKLSQNLDSLKEQALGPEKLFVVLAMEERVKGSKETAETLLEKYRGVFGRLWVTFHPANLPGEVVGKASNEAWAAKRAKEKLLAEGFNLKNLTLTSCDADAQFHPKYFKALTYEFATNPERYLRFWQSPIFWYNNLWQVPAFIKIVAILGNIGYIAQLQDPAGLFFNYSCYSASFSMVDEIGYWDTDIIPEDWHVFLQAFFTLEGKVEIEPIFLPTNTDAPESKTYFGSLVNRYRQCKRHAWGASDISYTVKQIFAHPEIPLVTRVLRFYKLVEGHLLWHTHWFLLTLGTTIPSLLNPAFKQTILGQNLPRIAGGILTICLFGLGTIIALDVALRPPKPKEIPWWVTPAYYLQWFLMPLATLFMSALPGLESHTRLMWGKHLEYRVTEKV
mgnify:CR=1 FL=1